MTLLYENKSPQYVVFKGKTIILTLDNDGDWRDDAGTIWPLADAGYASPGADNRCGVGIFSLPASDPDNEACHVHDYMFSSSTFQSFHRRSWADNYLKFLMRQMPAELHSSFPEIVWLLAREFGGMFWENKATND